MLGRRTWGGGKYLKSCDQITSPLVSKVDWGNDCVSSPFFSQKGDGNRSELKVLQQSQ